MAISIYASQKSNNPRHLSGVAAKPPQQAQNPAGLMKVFTVINVVKGQVPLIDFAGRVVPG